jgi:23S rRNA (cytidine1920-2'-O)/16S rRNA (cytidine1409-2'-O)-methyltransferase
LKNKIRLDQYVFEKGLSESLEQAKNKIIAGWVKVNGGTIRKPAEHITGTEVVLVARPGGNFASRGGEKLSHALDYFGISVKEKIAADLGSSTGGFTDCLLKRGAVKVYSVDVGYGLLAHNLRTDPRVIVREKTNVRSLTREDFSDIIDFITVDLSFISVLKISDKLKLLFSPASGIILLKPQFEAKAGEHEKGVVKEKLFHINILKRVINSLNESGIKFNGLHFSPVKGPAGNIEFLLYFKIDDCYINSPAKNVDIIIANVADEAHEKLSKLH